jgi:hypothetical protein
MIPGARRPRPIAEEEEVREVIPARAVLTELARGFLLVRENDRDRAVRFAVTFLKERSERAPRPEAAPYPAVLPGQRALARMPRGAVERIDPRVPR